MGDLYFARYWIQTLRFLTRSKLAEGDRSARLSTDRRDYALGDPVRMQVHFSDERLAPLDDNGVTVELEQIGRQTQKVQLHRTETGRGHFEAVLNNLPAGGYHAKLISPPLPGRVSAADFAVAPPQTEMARVQMDATEMQQAAEVTKGHYYTYKDASPPDRRFARRPAGADREPSARAALEPLAAAGVVPGLADRRMAAAEAEGDGVNSYKRQPAVAAYPGMGKPVAITGVGLERSAGDGLQITFPPLAQLLLLKPCVFQHPRRLVHGNCDDADVASTNPVVWPRLGYFNSSCGIGETHH